MAIFREILSAWPISAEPLVAVAVEGIFAYFRRRVRAYPEVGAVLVELRARGYRLGVLTDVPYGPKAERHR